MRLRRALIAAATLLCAGAFIAIEALPAAGASNSERTVLPGTATASAARVHKVAGVSRSAAISFQLVLRLRNIAGAQALVKAVSTPGSARYRHYLTARQWEARFSPTAADVAKAERWLRSEGLRVGKVSKDRITISASGTAARIESAFGIGLATYKVGGHNLRQATGNLSVPSSLAGVISGALGINQRVATPAVAQDPDISGSARAVTAPSATAGQYPPPPAAFITHPPCGGYYGARYTTLVPPFGMGYPNRVPDVVCGYKPGQFRSAYGVTSAATGKGVTVAIIDAYDSATIGADATQYFNNNDPGNPFSNADFTQIDQTPFTNQTECAASGWLTEQAIDVESVHSMATNAHITYVGAASCLDSDLFTAEQTVIDNGLANVVTNSWADTGGDLLVDASEKTAFDDEFLLAAGTGITVQYSSGDDGDNFYLLGFSSANYPSESPYVTAVGGTTLKIGAKGQRTGELGWDTGRSFLCTANLEGAVPGCDSTTLGTWLPASPDGISGGYTSYNYTQPFYQAGIVPTPLAERNTGVNGTTPMRVVPDISADADPGTGFLIGLTQTFPNGSVAYSQTRYGGTSLASPLLAGIVADADQQAGIPLGFLNPTIYRLKLQQPSAIYDVLPPVGNQGNYRVDYAGPLGLGLNATGLAQTFRELYYQGPETYCDATGNCATRPETLTTAPGYDSLTGLGSPGQNFISALAGF